MDIRQLRYFLTIVEEGSLSRAAAVLHVAQPSLSIHIRNMEADLGTALLFRSARGVVPTEAGVILLRHARAVLAQIALAEEEIRRAEAEPEGEVRLGLPATLGQILAVPLITAVHQTYPKIRLRISEAMSGFVLDWLEEARIDLALLYARPLSSAIESHPLMEEELRFLGSASAQAKGLPPPGQPVSLATALGLPLILPGAGHGLRALIETAAQGEGLLTEPMIDVDSYSTIKALVAEGLGFSILPETAVAREAAAGILQIWPLGEPGLRRSVYLAHASDRPLGQAVRVVQDMAVRVLRELVVQGRWSGARLLGEASASQPSGPK